MQGTDRTERADLHDLTTGGTSYQDVLRYAESRRPTPDLHVPVSGRIPWTLIPTGTEVLCLLNDNTEVRGATSFVSNAGLDVSDLDGQNILIPWHNLTSIHFLG